MPEFPSYGEKLISLLLCKTPTQKCWERTCDKCTKKKVTRILNDMFERSNNIPESVSWTVWKQDESKKRYVKYLMNGSMECLIKYFLEILDKFLKHSNVKRRQADAFENDRKELADCLYGVLALLQIDFAENFTCEAQDEIQSAHWNQRTVISIFFVKY